MANLSLKFIVFLKRNDFDLNSFYDHKEKMQSGIKKVASRKRKDR